MLDFIRDNWWRYVKLGFGALYICGGIGALMPYSEFRIQIAELETLGQPAVAKVTDIDVSETTSYSPSSSGPPEAIGALGPVGGFVGGFSGGMKLARALNGDTSGSAGRVTVNRRYSVLYSFTTADGRKIERSSPISDEHLDHLTPGAEMQVLYHPANPLAHRLTEYSSPNPLATWSGRLRGAAIFSAIGGFLLWRNWPAGNGAGGSTPRAAAVEAGGRVQRAVRTSQSTASPSSAPRTPRAPAPYPTGRGLSGGVAGARRGFGNRG
jgi:hypothetical protein